MKTQSEVLLVNFLDSQTKDFLVNFKHTFEALGYKVILLKGAKMSSIKREWQGHSWCFNAGMQKGNDTVESPCFQRNDLFLLQENKRVRLN